MMSMNQIPHRDWEALSAYVDGELSKRAKSRLEKRLQAEPVLQSALKELQRTQKILRDAPRLSAPRDFTLTPEMVGQPEQPRPARLFPVFRMATVLTSLLLAAILILDFGGGILSPNLAMAPAPLEEKAVEMEAPAALEAESAADERVAPTESPMEVEVVEESEEEALEAAQVAEEEMPAEDSQGEVMGAAEESEMEKAAEAEEGDMADATPTVTETAPLPTPTTVGQPSPTTAESPTFTPSPTRGDPQPAKPSPFPLWRILEVVLGVAALGFGVAAWRAKRKRN